MGELVRIKKKHLTPILILQAQPAEGMQVVKDLFCEYLTWANDMNEREFGLRLDIAIMLEEDMANLGKFMPPDGRLLLARHDGFTEGCVCLKKLGPGEDIADYAIQVAPIYFDREASIQFCCLTRRAPGWRDSARKPNLCSPGSF